MKPRETLLNSPIVNDIEIDEIGDSHISTSIETPIREDAFELDDDLKIELISKHFKEIMQILGLDLHDDSLSGTPNRVAKMYVKEIFSGLDPKNKPVAKLFENKYSYTNMLVEKNVHFFSTCEHHFVPIEGFAHVAYIPNNNKVIGLSKINRIVQYFAKRPQVQERMTIQVANEISKVLETDDVAVIMDAKHMCVSIRGVKDKDSSTVTSHFMGKFQEKSTQNELFEYLNLK